jgi:thiol-disulfide isomerase/thioredoxin
MKPISTLALLLFSLYCFCQSKSYEIVGTIAGQYTGKVHLVFERFTLTNDSLHADIKNGKFSFKGTVPSFPILAKLRLSGKSFIADVYIDEPKTQLECTNEFYIREGDTLQVFKIANVKGSKTESLKQEYEKRLASAHNAASEEAKKEVFYQHLSSFLKAHPQNKVSAYLLGKADGLTFTQVKALNGMLHASLQQTEEGKGVQRLLNDLYRPQYLNTAFFDVVLPDSSGQTVSTKQLRGKYTLIEVWASWCRPCRAKHPKLNELYTKYKDKGFVLTGVSLDKKKEDWIKALIKDGLHWPQLLDEQAMEGKLARHYGIEAIPSNFLLDSDGKIIGIDLQPEEVEGILSKSLN